MTCNVCNQLLDIEQRKIPVEEDDTFGEYWYISCDGNCKIVVDYDSGYATQWIENINYCPMCGKELKVNEE